VKYASYFVRNADGTINYINNTTMNLGGQKAAGVDVSASYAFPKTSYGDFKVSIDGTYLTQFDNQLYDGSPFVSNIGQFGLASNGTTSSFPIITYRWKHTAKLNWAKGNWNMQLTQNYNSKYTDQNLVAKQYWREHQLVQAVELHCDLQRLQEHAVVAGITNLFNAEPPATNSSLYSFGYLSSAASPIGRAYNVRVTYNF
jgi:iron complex outermembrane receptor protein